MSIILCIGLIVLWVYLCSWLCLGQRSAAIQRSAVAYVRGRRAR